MKMENALKSYRKILLTTVISFLMILAFCTVFSNEAKAEDIQEYGTGCIPDDEETLKSLLLDPITPYSEVELPSYVDLTDQFPTPGNQGRQNSCTAWAVAYALKSHQEYVEWGKEHNWDLKDEKCLYSPSYVYNQLNGGRDAGLGIKRAMTLIVEQGVCSLEDMPYDKYKKDPNCYKIQPVEHQKEIASNFKAKTINSIQGLEAVKQRLSENDGVVICIPVYPDFQNLNSNNPTFDQKNGEYSATHSICLIGYDDVNKRFKFINSWGTSWGVGGYGFISYDLFMDPDIAGGWGYVMTDANQHYTSNPIRVIANKNIKTYTDIGFNNAAMEVNAGDGIAISEFIDADCGNPPVFKINDTYGYVSAKKEDVRISTYTVTYNANGGTGSMDSSVVQYNTTENLKENTFTKTGYTFSGWYAKRSSGSQWLYKNTVDNTTEWYREGEEPSGYIKYKFTDKEQFSQLSYVDNGRVTFYAQWISNKYIIVYHPNGGDGALSTTRTKYDVNVTLKANQFTREGYTFTGWHAFNGLESKWFYKNYTTNETGWYAAGEQPSGYVKYTFADEESVLNLTSVNNNSVYLYAQWTANKYIIVYHPNGGDGASSTTRTKYDVNVTLKANQFTREGYTFTGWHAFNGLESKWFYKNYTTNETGWYIAGEQPSGYVKYTFADKENVLNLTSVNDNSVYLYAQWTPNDNV